MKQLNIAVVGGGAAGLMAAIVASENGAKVDIWERNERVGKKILATGNGKCNFSNRQMSMEHYYGSDLSIPQKILKEFDVSDTERFFQNLGMMIRAKDSLLYPYSEQASTVLDTLRFKVAEQDIQILTEELVTEIKALSECKFMVASKRKSKVYDRVIVTCGGLAAPKTGSDGKGLDLAKKLGHKITALYPALTGLKVKDNDFKAISGVRCQVSIDMLLDDKVVMHEKGELQLTDYGVSGIAIFQMSRIAGMGLAQKQKVQVVVDLCPDIELQELRLLLQRKKHQFADRNLDSFLAGFINKKLALYLSKKISLNPNTLMKEIKDDKIYTLANLCKKWILDIVDINSFEQAQVTAGGVHFAQLEDTLQSKLHRGLFFAGEILDVDGKCGGYNLQWAWSSGFVAGTNASKSN